MKATHEQEALLKKKIEEGLSLGEIQAALQQAGLNLTYMDLRFWIDDLGLALKEKPAPKAISAMTSPNPDGIPAPTSAQEAEPNAAGGVSVTLDTVVRAGHVVSGSATFTDGTTVQWALDQMGRLGLSDAPKGYKPSQSDLADFQTKLRELLESRAI